MRRTLSCSLASIMLLCYLFAITTGKSNIREDTSRKALCVQAVCSMCSMQKVAWQVGTAADGRPTRRTSTARTPIHLCRARRFWTLGGCNTPDQRWQCEQQEVDDIVHLHVHKGCPHGSDRVDECFKLCECPPQVFLDQGTCEAAQIRLRDKFCWCYHTSEACCKYWRGQCGSLPSQPKMHMGV